MFEAKRMKLARELTIEDLQESVRQRVIAAKQHTFKQFIAKMQDKSVSFCPTCQRAFLRILLNKKKSFVFSRMR